MCTSVDLRARDTMVKDRAIRGTSYWVNTILYNTGMFSSLPGRIFFLLPASIEVVSDSFTIVVFWKYTPMFQCPRSSVVSRIKYNLDKVSQTQRDSFLCCPKFLPKRTIHHILVTVSHQTYCRFEKFPPNLQLMRPLRILYMTCNWSLNWATRFQ